MSLPSGVEPGPSVQTRSASSKGGKDRQNMWVLRKLHALQVGVSVDKSLSRFCVKMHGFNSFDFFLKES